MSMLPIKKLKYDDGRTKQSFKAETDINRILSRAQKTGTISHLAKHEARYGDFAGFDFQEAQLMIAQGNQIFDELPSEIRKEFNQSPQEFFEFTNDPAHADKLRALLPALAEPGRQHISLKADPRPEEAPLAASAAAKPAPQPDPVDPT